MNMTWNGIRFLKLLIRVNSFEGPLQMLHGFDDPKGHLRTYSR
jgi:hypothetical protein